ncbi:MAG TPA: geranylgeranylglycerol-phosphate geranylgeranyltransferase [Bacteroidia bacterium]|jgi:4-hydroxybenzoate polyprenyltransferase|nr:geranylgeranylglycerol-phosphate geranylgeranyltransferase [Bacteroidia bacterium]
MVDTIKGFLKLIRWFHELVAIIPFVMLYLVITYCVQANGLSCNLSAINFSILCVCVQLLIAAGCIFNDIMDRHIDKINKPHTHIVGRVISLGAAKKLFVATTILILLLSAYISMYLFTQWVYISIAVYMLSILYSLYLKKSPLFGNVTVALLASFIPLVILLFAKNCIAMLNNPKITILIYLYAAFSFFIIIPRELSLDISDIEGDRAGGCKTLPIVIGIKKAKQVVLAFLVLIILFSLFLMCKYTYLISTFSVVDILLLIYIYKFNQTHTRLAYIKIGRFLWFIMIVGLIGFALATI